MKILKSGVEMTPKELNKLKGGACACGCNFSAMGLSNSGEEGGDCYCGCKGGGISAFRGGFSTAADYL